jgi:CDP-glycerol glycerophosphotransferase (TagB/SpsB family)
MIFYPLYIDPGTGSALFSIAIGIVAAVYFLFRALFLKLRVVLFRNKNVYQTRHQFVIYAEDKRYWAFFESVLDEFEARQIELLYLTSSEDDPVFSSHYNFIKGKYIGKGNKAFAYLNFLPAAFVLTTTPELDVLQWKRSKAVGHYCHYVHGAGGALLYRLFSMDYFDSILVGGETEIPEIRSLEHARNIPEKQLVVVGNTFFDRCSEKIKSLPAEKEHQFTVLVSPSWGPSALLKVYGEKLLDPLIKTGWHIIIRPHPQSLIVEKPLVNTLIEKYGNCSNIEWDYNHENIYSMAKSDIMISDFSGIIYDFVFLFDRPVMVSVQHLDFRRLDVHNVSFEPYFFQALKEIGIELEASLLDSIKDTIEDMVRNPELREIRNKIKNTMWQYQGEAGKRIVNFMTETVNREENQP